MRMLARPTPSEWPICPHCGAAARLTNGREFYEKRPDLFEIPLYACTPCGARVGCHPGTLRPLGTLANAPLRTARKRLHAALDPLWREGPKQGRKTLRTAIYRRLAEKLEIEPEQCHVGMFDLATCERAMGILQSGLGRAWLRREAGR